MKGKEWVYDSPTDSAPSGLFGLLHRHGGRHLTGKALELSPEGMSGSQLLVLAQKDSRPRGADLIDGGWVHVDVE